MSKPKVGEYNKVRRLRLSDETLDALKKHKKRGQSWDLLFKELLNEQPPKNQTQAMVLASSFRIN